MRGRSDRVDQWMDENIKKLFKTDGAPKGATIAIVVTTIGGEGGATLSSSPTIGYLVIKTFHVKYEMTMQ